MPIAKAASVIRMTRQMTIIRATGALLSGLGACRIVVPPSVVWLFMIDSGSEVFLPLTGFIGDCFGREMLFAEQGKELLVQRRRRRFSSEMSRTARRGRC